MNSTLQKNKDIFIHELARCETSHVGSGTRIWAYAHVMAEAQLGSDCNVGESVYIENKVSIGNGCTIKNQVAIWDRVTLEDQVFVGPNAVFTNDLKPRAFLKRDSSVLLATLIKRGATIGANSTIVCGITVGEFSMVGAGAVVIKNVAPHTLVVGNPARPICRICFCGEKLDAKDFCSACQRKLLDNSLQLTQQLLKQQH